VSELATAVPTPGGEAVKPPDRVRPPQPVIIRIASVFTPWPLRGARPRAGVARASRRRARRPAAVHHPVEQLIDADERDVDEHDQHAGERVPGL